MSRHRLLLAGSGLLLIASVVGPAGVAHAAGTGIDSCHVQTLTTASTDWLESGVSRRVNEDLAAEVGRRFGAGSKADPLASVRSGLIGLTVDHSTQSIVAMVDPALPNRDALSQALSGVVDRARGAAAAGPRIRVQSACHSTAEILYADKVLRARDWHPDVRTASIGGYLDPADATFHVTVDPGHPDVATALKGKLGDLVTVTLDDTGRTGRVGDASPHKGGANIRRDSTHCTAGFSVQRSDGYRAMVTAGHCFDNVQSIYSGDTYFGITDGEYNYPVYDMIEVTSSTETYTNVIYVDPCCPTTRVVVNRGDPFVNDLVCVSGAVTKARCALRVLNFSGWVCNGNDCTYALITARRDDGGIVVQLGDSGAPMYSRPGNTTATINGLLIGRGESGAVAYAELVSNVEAHLGVQTLTWA